MSKLSNILLEKEILLESGTNELEVLVFDVGQYTFGINVAKVREVLPRPEIIMLPRAHRSIRGVFRLRENVIPCVSLVDHLGISQVGEGGESTLILADFNRQQTGFLVDKVERIHRLSWQEILAVPGLEALSHTPVTALARCDERLIVMLDFEMILDDVTEQYFRTDEVANPLGLPRDSLRILLAEDSPTVREAIRIALHNSGYRQLECFENGAQAWQWIDERFRATGRVEDIGDLLIADVEMPQVDGLHLTKRIKEHAQLKCLPVLLYSSIITPDNQKKGLAVGADAQVAKPELSRVVELADKLISDARRGQSQAAWETISTTTASLSSCSAVRPPVDQRKPEPSTVPAAEPVSITPPKAVPQPELAPPTLEGGEPDPRVWQTFHREMTDRSRHLQQIVERLQGGRIDVQWWQVLARTLHTIKSAAMVVPVTEISRPTHLLESLVAAETPAIGEGLHRYLTWIDSVLTATAEQLPEALATGSELEAELERLLSSL